MKKRIWTGPRILKRNELGSSALLLERLRNEDLSKFKSALLVIRDMIGILLSLDTKNTTNAFNYDKGVRSAVILVGKTKRVVTAY